MYQTLFLISNFTFIVYFRLSFCLFPSLVCLITLWFIPFPLVSTTLSSVFPFCSSWLHVYFLTIFDKKTSIISLVKMLFIHHCASLPSWLADSHRMHLLLLPFLLANETSGNFTLHLSNSPFLTLNSNMGEIVENFQFVILFKFLLDVCFFFKSSYLRITWGYCV
jgi:hypothetical protein